KALERKYAGFRCQRLPRSILLWLLCFRSCRRWSLLGGRGIGRGERDGPLGHGVRRINDEYIPHKFGRFLQNLFALQIRQLFASAFSRWVRLLIVGASGAADA